MMRKGIIKLLLVLVGVTTLGLLFGPKPEFPRYALDPMYLKVQLEDLDAYVADQESNVDNLKRDNQARIVWHNDSIAKTEYSLVYLHGFSASQEEGNPVHRDFAKRYGMNLFLARLEDHGRSDPNSFEGLTPKALITSAKEAIAIGALLGEKVVVMSCSTGGTYSIMLAPDDERISALIMYSPNIAIKDPAAALVTYPWGQQLLRQVMGGETNHIDYEPAAKQYWNEDYHVDGIVAMQSLLDDGMKEEYFAEIDIPVYLGCYYQDEVHQDQVVSVEKMEWFFENITTPSAKKRFVKFPQAGRHVFTSKTMKDEFDVVQASTNSFAEEVLLLPIDED